MKKKGENRQNEKPTAMVGNFLDEFSKGMFLQGLFLPGSTGVHKIKGKIGRMRNQPQWWKFLDECSKEDIFLQELFLPGFSIPPRSPPCGVVRAMSAWSMKTGGMHYLPVFSQGTFNAYQGIGPLSLTPKLALT